MNRAIEELAGAVIIIAGFAMVAYAFSAWVHP